MSGDTCTCGDLFRSGEDWRDHMPCPGNDADKLKAEKAKVKILAEALEWYAEPTRYTWPLVERSEKSDANGRIRVVFGLPDNGDRARAALAKVKL